MPGFDRRGPEGQGPKTGRAMGKCNPDHTEHAEKDVQGGGRRILRRLHIGYGRRDERTSGRGQGRKRGRRRNNT
ncbi:MAG: DUF5320 domain-containing protein [Bacteroidales bacterium]